jgi:metallophosphoesterase (TIGR00282 family)
MKQPIEFLPIGTGAKCLCLINKRRIKNLNILVIGDIVGKPGREILKSMLSWVQSRYNIDFTIANAENAAGGRGLTLDVKNELLGLGIDCLTMGNHVWDNKNIFSFIDDEPRLIRPINYPGDCPGQGMHIYKSGFNKKIAVINASGRVFLPALDCPFRAMDDILAEINADADYIIVDFHAEATSEKVAFGYYLDGRVSAVCTHTHIQTADERVLPNGTAYITDLGMTGPIDSILGMEKQSIIDRFLNARPTRFQVADGPAHLQGVVLQLAEDNKKAVKIERISHVLSNKGII